MALAAALLAAGCGGSSTPAPHTRTAPLISIFEAPLQLASTPGPALDTLKRLGVDYVRVNVYWDSLAPDPASHTEPAGFDGASPSAYPQSAWAPYDAIVQGAKARGIGVYFTLTGPAPVWASGPGWPGTKQNNVSEGVWKPSAADFEAFVRAVGARYSGSYTPPGASSPLPRVSFWSLWNEPNLGAQNLAPQATASNVETSPAMYRRLLDAGWSALHATGHGSDTILIGELAPYGGPNPYQFGYMTPLRFVRALYCVGSSLRPLTGAAAGERGCPTTTAASKQFAAENPGLFQATGYAVHPYLLNMVAPNATASTEPDWANLAALHNLDRLLRTATGEYGDSRTFPLYVTEFGYITDPPLNRAGWASPALAANYENWAEYISWRNPLVRSFDHYLLVDPGPGTHSDFFSGLEFYGGTPKPTYAAFRMPLYMPITTARNGHSLEVWGCVRPAHYAQLETGATQRVQIQLKPAGGSFRTIDTVPISSPDGYFGVDVRFGSSGTVRLAWAYPQGATIYSRSVQVTVG